jgi:hypothetical protein
VKSRVRTDVDTQNASVAIWCDFHGKANPYLLWNRDSDCSPSFTASRYQS